MNETIIAARDALAARAADLRTDSAAFAALADAAPKGSQEQADLDLISRRCGLYAWDLEETVRRIDKR